MRKRKRKCVPDGETGICQAWRPKGKQHVSRLQFAIRVLVRVLLVAMLGKRPQQAKETRYLWGLAVVPCPCPPCHFLASPAAVSSSSLSWSNSFESLLPDKSVVWSIYHRLNDHHPQLILNFRVRHPSTFAFMSPFKFLIGPAQCSDVSTKHYKSVTWWAINPACHMDKGDTVSPLFPFQYLGT